MNLLHSRSFAFLFTFPSILDNYLNLLSPLPYPFVFELSQFNFMASIRAYNCDFFEKIRDIMQIQSICYIVTVTRCFLLPISRILKFSRIILLSDKNVPVILCFESG